jgi:hypothetical protein
MQKARGCPEAGAGRWRHPITNSRSTARAGVGRRSTSAICSTRNTSTCFWIYPWARAAQRVFQHDVLALRA